MEKDESGGSLTFSCAISSVIPASLKTSQSLAPAHRALPMAPPVHGNPFKKFELETLEKKFANFRHVQCPRAYICRIFSLTFKSFFAFISALLLPPHWIVATTECLGNFDLRSSRLNVLSLMTPLPDTSSSYSAGETSGVWRWFRTQNMSFGVQKDSPIRLRIGIQNQLNMLTVWIAGIELTSVNSIQAVSEYRFFEPFSRNVTYQAENEAKWIKLKPNDGIFGFNIVGVFQARSHKVLESQWKHFTYPRGVSALNGFLVLTLRAG